MSTTELSLNQREFKVLKLVASAKPSITLADLAKAAFPGKGVASATKGSSWTRNSLRKLRDHKLILQVGRGRYGISKRGQAALASA